MALRVCSGMCSTSVLTQTYCRCKSGSSHMLLLTSHHEYLNKYTYMHTYTHTTRPSIVKNTARSHVWLMALSQKTQLWSSSVAPDTVWWYSRWEKYPKHAWCTRMRLPGTAGVTGCIHANASLLTDRWHTSRPICSFTSTIKIHSSIFQRPVCQRCSVFLSVKWIKWASCQKRGSFHIPDIVACLRLEHVRTEIWSALARSPWLIQSDGFWFQSSAAWPLFSQVKLG